MCGGREATMTLPRVMTVREATCLACGDFTWATVLAATEKEELPWLLALCDDCLRVMTSEAMPRWREEEASIGKFQAEHRSTKRFPYYGPNWDAIRRKTLDRDGNQCRDEAHVEAGGSKPDDNLVVHHVKPLREFAGNYEAANVDSNLITLCKICHGREHARLKRESEARQQQ